MKGGRHERCRSRSGDRQCRDRVLLDPTAPPVASGAFVAAGDGRSGDMPRRRRDQMISAGEPATSGRTATFSQCARGCGGAAEIANETGSQVASVTRTIANIPVCLPDQLRKSFTGHPPRMNDASNF
jgi:hypothetical protein